VFKTVYISFQSLTSIVRGSTEFTGAMLAISRDFTVVFVTSFYVIVAQFIYATAIATLNGSYTSV